MALTRYNSYDCEKDRRHLFTPRELASMRAYDARIEAEFIANPAEAAKGVTYRPCMSREEALARRRAKDKERYWRDHEATLTRERVKRAKQRQRKAAQQEVSS